ncbi:MAG: cyclic nucleotide-binding domain-containing protein [Bacteroidetes bacterium]|nr:cyclic nucleotide-binding domain-containing protein [Bacteroidota bacterium]
MSSPSIPDRLATLLENTPPFDLLEDQERRELVGTMTVAFFEPGDVIMEQGIDVHRSLYLVEEGLVRLMNVEEKRLIDMCGAPSQFGSYGILQGGILPYEARAVEQTSCALVPADRFRELLKANEAFAAYFDEDIKRYVRTIDTALDASGAFLLFDTELARLSREAVVVEPDTPVRAVAQAMRDADADTVVVVENGVALGVITEGDIVEKVVARGESGDMRAMQLVDRPAVALDGSERLFDAVKAMMRHRIRRVVVIEKAPEEGEIGLGILSASDVSHYRGLDPVATIELIERARTVDALASLRSESNRRLLRLYQQGVQSEDLLGVVSELDDQIKRRLLHLVEKRAQEEHPGMVVEVPWGWLSFGTAGRKESTIYARQHNGLVYANPEDDAQAERASEWFSLLADAACEAHERCGYSPSGSGILARNEAFCQPLSRWQEMYTHWVQGEDAPVTARAVMTFDARLIYGDEALGEALRSTIAEHTPNPRLLSILVNQGAQINVPMSVFGRFQLERDDDGKEGFDVRARGLRPVVDFARALALEIGYLKSANTFDRLRAVEASDSLSVAEAKSLLPALRTLSDLHLRLQMQAAEVGETPTDWMDPGTLHKSQQNLLKDTLKTVQRVQQSLASRYVQR